MRERQVVAHRNTTQQYVLPIDPILLTFLAPEKLLNAVRIASVSGTLPTAQISLTFSRGRGGDDIQHWVTKSYEAEILEEEPVACGVWPDFKISDWKTYFLVVQTRRGEKLEPYCGFVLSELVDVASTPDKRTAIGAIANLRSSIESRALRRIVDPSPARANGGEPITWLHAFGNVPEALLCNANANPRKDGARDIVNPDMRFAGLLVMPTEELCPAYTGRVFNKVELTQDETPWIVGIDFGTSNTSVYAAPAGGTPARLDFEARLVEPFTPGNDQAVEAAAEIYIKDGVLGKKVPSVFQTILQVRPSDNSGIQAPIWSHRVMFNSSLRLNLTQANRPDTVFGRELKWGIGLTASRAELLQKLVGMYLEQTVLQSVAECASRGVPPRRINVKFSFPEAFGSFTRRTFQNKCKQALDTLTGDLSGKGLHVHPQALDEQNFESNSESRCAAVYFATRKKAYFSETVVVFDVGGGSTDVVIVKAGRVLWHASLRLAAQEVFVQPLLRTGLLDNLLSNTPSLREIGKLYATLSDEQKFNAAEVIINSSDTAKDIMSIASNISAESKWLSGIVSLAYGGLIYYVGCVLKQVLSKAGEQRVGTERIHLCFGGRGSRMFSNFVAEAIQDGAGKLFLSAADLSNVALEKSVFSAEPKEEVAYGLVAGHAAQQELIWDERSLVLPPLGENVTRRADGMAKAAMDNFKALAPSTDWVIADDTPEFSKFLELFRNYTGVRVDLNNESFLRSVCSAANGESDGFTAELKNVAAELSKIADEEKTGVGDRTRSQQQTDAALLSRQPPFILLLRQMIRALASDGPNGTRATVDVGD